MEDSFDFLFINNIFEYHTSSKEEDRVSNIASGFGGINALDTEKVVIEDCIFRDNIAAQGGGNIIN